MRRKKRYRGSRAIDQNSNEFHFIFSPLLLLPPTRQTILQGLEVRQIGIVEFHSKLGLRLE
jgi:hypothetical protein